MKWKESDSYTRRMGQQMSNRKCEKAIDREEEQEIAAEANMQGQQMVSVGLK